MSPVPDRLSSDSDVQHETVTVNMGASLAGIVDAYKQRSGLTDTVILARIGMSRMNLNLWGQPRGNQVCYFDCR